MSTLATPSAKAHERVTGRWMRDFNASNRKEVLVYYAKTIAGSPIPWLLWAYVCLTFFSRAGLEIAAWSCALLTLIYIAVDRVTSNREFRFFRIGSDFLLLGYALVSIIGAANSGDFSEALETLGGARWVILLYAITYCWELFPGLNRAYLLMLCGASAAAFYGIWQHFMGLDLIRGTELMAAPAPGHILFSPNSFFNGPEILGTLLAMVAPFPAAAYLLSDRAKYEPSRLIPIALFLFFVVAVFWTYRPGIWLALSAGTIVTMLMNGRNAFSMLVTVVVFLGGMMAAVYSDTGAVMDSVQNAEVLRADKQREQINMQVQLWQESSSHIWFGAGHKALSAASFDRGNGNVYFQILAQSGILGAAFYLLFLLNAMLTTYRMYIEIPRSHHWHRVLVAGALGSQVAFHVSGLYWFTLAEAFTMNLFVLILASLAYLNEHYGRGLVPDDQSL